MAHLLNETTFNSPDPAVTSFNVTIPATSAGSTLVIISGAGSTVVAKLGVGGTTFTKRTTSLGLREVTAQDIVDTNGGTTTIPITLNGADNVTGIIYEFASGTLGSFVTGNTNSGSGGNPSIDNNTGWATIAPITTTSPTVVFAMYTASDSSGNISNQTRQFWGFEPLGKQYMNTAITNDPTKSLFWVMIGVSDQTSASGGTYTSKSSRWVLNAEHQSVVWAYQDLASSTPTYANPYPNATVAENSLPGSMNGAWFTGPGGAVSGKISGYTDNLSYNPGDTVNFKVDSADIGFDVEIYRLGYYGYTTFGARWQTTFNGTPATQPAPTIDSYGGTVCSWSTTAAWAIPATATPGVYLYNLRRSDNTGYLFQSLFVVKSPVPSSKTQGIMLTMADTTWQAYNVWGATTDAGGGYAGYTGRSLYGQGPNQSLNARAFAVSYDRPIGVIGANAATFYWDSEGGLVAFLEGNGYEISYFTMIDLEKNPAIPSMYTTAISSGHSEYWSSNMRDAFEDARDSGTNVMFFTSNTSLWHVRFDPADTNKRRMICYKDSHATTGYDGVTQYDPGGYTGTWRDPRTTVGGVNNTERRPENSMTGQWFIGNANVNERIAVPDDYKNLPIWRNTRVTANPGIAVRGTSSNFMTTAGTNTTISTPSATQTGDLVLVALTFDGQPSGFNTGGLRVIFNQVPNEANQVTILLTCYAAQAGSTTYFFNWSNNLASSQVCTVYSGAVWEDSGSGVFADTGGGSTHTTPSVGNGGSNRWAVCVFADVNANGTQKTTSWTAGTGLTSRVQTNNSTNSSGSWTSIAMMDTNAASTQGFNTYSATAQFGNPNASAGIMYISPGTTLMGGTIGTEWDYVKAEEPTTPTNMIMLNKQAIQISGQRSDYYGHNYGGAGTIFYSMTIYEAPSGALVFCAATWQYAWGISYFSDGSDNYNSSIDPAMQQAVLNLMTDFGNSPPAILSTTANNNATALVSPGSAASPSQYGLTITSKTQYQSIFDPSLVVTSTSNYDGTAYTMGTVFEATSNGKIYGARWYFPDNLPSMPVTAILYSWTSDSTGTQLATTPLSNYQTGWSQGLFSSPISITANTLYVIAIWTSDYYPSTSNLFTNSGVTNSSGTLTAPQSTNTTHNGKYVSSNSGPTYPTTTFQGGCYFADVLFQGSGTVNFVGWGQPIG
ncbi:MAG TPA: N,N-dimethylformamidase beta subunit family domain-containing protein [Candidatus Saccharimonadales bacterium]|nr:N,N-dimethylformamidase beta subunit family domain-containing protein [Candidatus Saccharimonadales bacterium]